MIGVAKEMKVEVRERGLWNIPKRGEEAPWPIAFALLPEWNKDMRAGASAAVL